MGGVAVVGAGPAGLCALKELAGAGFDVTCFEKGDRPGGLWVYENESGRSGAYRSLHTNTSRARTELEDHPMPDDYPDFPSHELVAAWLESYADRFGLRERIRFHADVERAERRPEGGWELTLEDGSVREFDVLVAASGHNWEPRWPEPAYPGDFDGVQIHAHDYREPSGFEGRRVLVVGMGNSAMDIAVEASYVAERTFLSTRKGTHIVPKQLFGKPADQITSPLMARVVPWRVRQRLSEALLRIAVGRVTDHGLPEPSGGLLQDHPTISDTILSRIAHGEVLPRPGIERLDGRRVVFADGSAEAVDAIVWCTGYEVTLPFLQGAVGDVRPDELKLYKRVVHPEMDDLFFIGFMQSTGSAIPIVEQQSKLLAEYLTGEYALPAPDAMRADMERALRGAVKRYGHKRPAMRVDFDGFMHELERERRRGRKRARGAPPLAGRKRQPEAVAA